MAIKTSEVYRCLEKKTLVFGFEMLDLFAVFTVFALLSLILSGIHYKAVLTWGPTLALALFLRFGKSGKPENFLLHWVHFQFSPGVLSAFPLATSARSKARKTEGSFP